MPLQDAARRVSPEHFPQPKSRRDGACPVSAYFSHPGDAQETQTALRLQVWHRRRAQPYSPQAALLLPGRIRSVPAQAKSPTTVTPRLTRPGSEAFRFVCFPPCIASRDPFLGREGFRRAFQRGRPRSQFQPGTYFFKAQPRFSRSRSPAQVAHPTGQPYTGKPDLTRGTV